MSWFSREEVYSITDSGFYGEPEITYGKKDDDDSTPPPASGAWDDYQHEREHIYSCGHNDYSR